MNREINKGCFVSGAGATARVVNVTREGSWRGRALNLTLRLASQRKAHISDYAELRRRYERLDARYVRLDRSITLEAVDCDGVPAHWVHVPASLPGRTIFYLHGGSFAFRFPKAQTAFVARLCQRLRASALVPDYRLAPEHPFPAAPDDCQRAWLWAQRNGFHPTRTVFVGDSAGGNLSLVTIHRSLRNKDPVPACAVLLSPAVDGSLGSPSLTNNHHSDAIIQLSKVIALRDLYVPDPNLYRHPDVSPIFADFAGFPSLYVQVSNTELLRDESLRLAEKAYAAGVDVEVEMWPDVPHGFQFAWFLPEASRAIDRISDFIAAKTGWRV